jgi:excinuclease UvrABC ATPase subunit
VYGETDYPRNQQLLYAESFSPNTPEGACPNCHGIGRVHAVDEGSPVLDDTLTIRPVRHLGREDRGRRLAAIASPRL